MAAAQRLQRGDGLPRIGVTGPRLPVGPLLAKFRTGGAAAEACGVSLRAVDRWKHSGLTLLQADRVAGHAGYHPADIWGDAWYAEPTAAE